MNASGRSSDYGRCQQREITVHVARRRKATACNFWILAGVMLISAFCATLIVLRMIGVRGKYLELNAESSTESQLRPGFLESVQCSPVCYTKECIRTAADILEMLDPEASPCEDFYQYACGRFQRHLTEHKKKERYLWIVEYEAIKFFQDSIREMPKSIPNNAFGSSVIKLRKFYDSCMDLRSLEENTISTAFKYLEYFGIRDWPYLNYDYRFSNPELDEALIRMFFYELRPFFQVNAQYLVPRDATGGAAQTYELTAENMKIKMNRAGESIFHSEGIVIESKTKLMKEVLEFFVPNITLRDQISAEVLAFDLAISDVSQRANERREECKRNVTADCITILVYDCGQRGNEKKERWCRITEKILELSGVLAKHPTISIKLTDGDHFQELGELIDSTDQRILAYTLAIYFFLEKEISVSFAFRSREEFRHKVASALLKKYFYEKNENRSPFCLMLACYRLPILAEMLFYYRKYHNSNLGREINEMYSDLKHISLSTVKNISWIDSEAKESLEELFSSIEFSPETFMQRVNISGFVEAYQKVVITEKSFLANELESQKLRSTLYIRNMDRVGKQSGLRDHPVEFNPHYSYFPRTVFFEFANFLLPLIGTDRPRYVNLGTLGFVLGHEFAHAFEFPIKTFEKSEAFEDALKEKMKCLEDHYFKYEVYTTGEKVKGNETYTENVADFFGIRTAFKSLNKYQEIHSEDKMLPGLRFSNEEMFFIIAAQNFCEENTKESQEDYLKDRHSPPNVRINAMYRNFDAFSRAFGCPEGSAMNPATKCSFQ